MGGVLSVSVGVVCSSWDIHAILAFSGGLCVLVAVYYDFLSNMVWYISHFAVYLMVCSRVRMSISGDVRTVSCSMGHLTFFWGGRWCTKAG